MCGAHNSASAQGNVGYINSIQASGGFGLSSYYGDLCDGWKCMRFRHNINAAFIYRASDRIMGRAEINIFKLYGDDKFSSGLESDNSDRNLNFKSNGIDLELTASYDLISYERRYGHRDDFHPYVFAGIGIMRFNPKGLNLETGKWQKLHKLQTEGRNYARTTLILPYGFGIRYMWDEKTNINFEFGYRMAFTDYLDDVSRTYVDNASLGEDAANLADKSHYVVEQPAYNDNAADPDHWREGHQRGNPRAGDGYFLFGFKVEYKIKYTTQKHFKLFKRPKFSH